MERQQFLNVKTQRKVPFVSPKGSAVIWCPKNVMTRQGTALLWWAPMQKRNRRSRTTSGRSSGIDFLVAYVDDDEGDDDDE